jgi:hypothetical protein
LGVSRGGTTSGCSGRVPAARAAEPYTLDGLGTRALQIISTILLPISLITFLYSSCYGRNTMSNFDDVQSIETAIKKGAIGKVMAERANKQGHLNLKEIKNAGIPFRIYYFDDYQAGNTVMVEGNKLILLCSGFGGGYAHNFQIKEENNKKILTYAFSTGSGISRPFLGRYILGSGQAPVVSEETERKKSPSNKSLKPTNPAKGDQ